MYNVGYAALLISLFKLFYVINYNLLVLFNRSILVPCHQCQSSKTTWVCFTSLMASLITQHEISARFYVRWGAKQSKDNRHQWLPASSNIVTHRPPSWPEGIFAYRLRHQQLITVACYCFYYHFRVSITPLPCVNKKFLNSDGHQMALIFKNRLICLLRYNALLITLEPARKS